MNVPFPDNESLGCLEGIPWLVACPAARRAGLCNVEFRKICPVVPGRTFYWCGNHNQLFSITREVSL